MLDVLALLCWCGPVCTDAACGAPHSLLLIRKISCGLWKTALGVLCHPSGLPRAAVY